MDVIIYGKNKTEHDEHLLKVLQKIRENGIKLNLKKCGFGVSEINYLGHILSEDGIKLDFHKIDAT